MTTADQLSSVTACVQIMLMIQLAQLLFVLCIFLVVCERKKQP